MIQRWKQLGTRFAAMPRRERLLLPGALCFAILMIGYLFFIEPAIKQFRQMRQQHQQESNDLTLAQAQVTVLKARLQNPDAELRAQLEALRGQTRQVDDQFKALQGSLVPAQQMSQWLSGLLQAQRGLQLVGLRSLPVSSMSELVNARKAAAAGGAASAPAAADTAAQEAWLYRHGVEVTLRGNYQELLAYLQTLERMPRRVYWGELKINAQDSPAVVMTLTVYTLSVEKTWWAI
jgi:MSHA biogenesis protein MshJ